MGLHAASIRRGFRGAAASPAAVPKPVASAPKLSGGGLSIQPQISFSVSFRGAPS
ncbi:MAG: hypothetical protein LBP38_01375 [Desulfovibrio sp.]|jgi:hypothetical protein|nr:hypothetical protein [Desulfovibrio sp.]